MAKSEQKLKARKIRKEGESIKKIAKLLNVSVGSVSMWCRDIYLTEEQIKKLSLRVTDPYYGRKKKYLEKIKRRTNLKINRLKKQGIKEIGKLTKRDILMIGIALYWGEGFKKDHQVGLATSDTKMAKFFIFWLKKCFDISKRDLILRITANSSYKEKIMEIEKYWSQELNVPINNFSKPFFQQIVWKKEYENKNEYHGVLRIKVRKSQDFLRKISGYIEGLSLGAKN